MTESNHKNTLKTAWNDVTGDTIKTGKGSQEKYAQNWDAIFGKKKNREEEPKEVKALDFHDGSQWGDAPDEVCCKENWCECGL